MKYIKIYNIASWHFLVFLGKIQYGERQGVNDTQILIIRTRQTRVYMITMAVMIIIILILHLGMQS